MIPTLLCGDPLEIRLPFRHWRKRWTARRARRASACRRQAEFACSNLPRIENKQIPQWGICLFGDPLEIRTPDPLLKRQLLCQLS